MMLFKRLISKGLNGEVVSYQIRKSTILIRVIMQAEKCAFFAGKPKMEIILGRRFHMEIGLEI